MIFENPLVVGYKGEIGSFILQGLLKYMPKAKNIWCFDINETEEEKIERIHASDYIFLCVPLNETLPWLQKYKERLKGKTIVEQTSLKSGVVDHPDIIHLRIIGMHILFRPSATPDRKDRRCIIVDNLNTNFAYTVGVIFGVETIFVSTYEEHDKQMAYAQTLMHRVILTLNDVARTAPETYIGSKINELAQRIMQGDYGLYKMIQENVHGEKVIKEFYDSLDTFNLEAFIKKDKTVRFGGKI